MKISNLLTILSLVFIFSCKTEQKKDANPEKIEQTVLKPEDNL